MSGKVEKDNRWGITETCDPAFALEVFDNLCVGNTIITKRLTNALITKLIENKDKCILHLTCTNLGEKIEPFVPSVDILYEKFNSLIEGGFPVSHVVLRIDPIVPTEKGVKTAMGVIDKFFPTSGIKRVRISFLDMYKHVVDRFNDNGISIPYESFHAPYELRNRALNLFKEKALEYGFELELCGEPNFPSIPCLSQKDVDILGVGDKITLCGEKGQRSSCHCPSNKTQLYHGEMKRCKHKCLYCYLKGD